jgi:hypothetical protein
MEDRAGFSKYLSMYFELGMQNVVESVATQVDINCTKAKKKAHMVRIARRENEVGSA